MRKARGFTIVEILIVVTVIGILLGLVAFNYIGGLEKAKYTRAQAELQTFANAFRFYLEAHDDYPPDQDRGELSVISEFITNGENGEDWPNSPWGSPSVFDYDAWDIDEDGTNDTFQISIRFCPIGGSLTDCKFPDEPWAEGFGVDSAIYYCLDGYCRSHATHNADYPGYCVNCPNSQAISI